MPLDAQSYNQHTSPLSTLTNASILENPSSCKVLAISSIRCLHLPNTSLLIQEGKLIQWNDLQEKYKQFAKVSKECLTLPIYWDSENDTSIMK